MIVFDILFISNYYLLERYLDVYSILTDKIWRVTGYVSITKMIDFAVKTEPDFTAANPIRGINIRLQHYIFCVFLTKRTFSLIIVLEELMSALKLKYIINNNAKNANSGLR